MSRPILSCGVALVVLAGGCGSPQVRDTSRNHQLEREVDELKAQRRRDRRRIRDLENTKVVEIDRSRRELPVEVRRPEPADPPAQESIVELEDGAVGTIAHQDDDYEVVYVGEAAKDRSVRPSIELYETRSRSVSPPPAAVEPPRVAARRAPPPARSVEPIAPPNERLAVTTGRVPPLTAADARASTRAVATKPPTPVPVPLTSAKTHDPRELYKRYYKALRAGNHKFAIVGFRGFIARFPRHELADNARYWLGEAFYDQTQYDRAIVEFTRVVDDYPKGNKVADAALKRAYCYIKLGKLDQGRSALAYVIEEHPSTNAARLATDRLNQLEDNDK